MSEILDGVMFNKDVTHTGMKRRIENPRFAISMYIIPYNTSISINYSIIL